MCFCVCLIFIELENISVSEIQFNSRFRQFNSRFRHHGVIFYHIATLILHNNIFEALLHRGFKGGCKEGI